MTDRAAAGALAHAISTETIADLEAAASACDLEPWILVVRALRLSAYYQRLSCEPEGCRERLDVA